MTVPTGITATSDVRLRPARSELLASVPGVAHGVSHRVEGLGKADGNIGLGSPRDKADAWAMRQLWAEAIGVNAETIVTGGQVHGTGILRIEAGDAGKGSR
jgi:copper oxidase (laccase) domain-containing protein